MAGKSPRGPRMKLPRQPHRGSTPGDLQGFCFRAVWPTCMTEVSEMEQDPREECGVFGVWAPGEDVAKRTYYGLYALQHRGPQAAGIAAADDSQMLVFKDLGLVSQVFDERTLAAMPGHPAIGRCRYSATGSTAWGNAPPVFHTTAVG